MSSPGTPVVSIFLFSIAPQNAILELPELSGSEEKELGFSLFTRTQKGLILTNNGQELLPYIRRILTDNELFEQEIAALREGGFQDIDTWLEKGSIDFGLTGLDPTNPMEWIPLKKDNKKPLQQREAF